MPTVEIKRDDLVRVISGKDRGKEGRVLRVMPVEGTPLGDLHREALEDQTDTQEEDQ